MIVPLSRMILINVMIDICVCVIRLMTTNHDQMRCADLVDVLNDLDTTLAFIYSTLHITVDIIRLSP